MPLASLMPGFHLPAANVTAANLTHGSAMDLLPYQLWCTPGETILSCLAPPSLGFVPHAMLHLGLFYGAVVAASIARRRGVVWDERSFKTVFHVAWHVPNIISCVPVSLGALETVQRLLGDDDAARFGTFDTVKDYALLEACVWFGTYLALDTVLATVHKMADVELAVHHLIFASVCYIMFSSGTAPLVGAALIVQELSTPFLNSFLLLRGFCGLGSLWTQLAFGCFALTFYATRVGLNTAVTSLFLRELYRGFVGGTTHLMYSRVEQMLLAAALVGGWCLQVYWGITITKKLIGAIRGEASEKPKAA